MQRLLALGALVLATLVHVNTVRADASIGRSLIADEVESIGADVLQSLFDRIAGLPFDAVATATDPEQLTPAAQFGQKAWASASDLDDLHGASTVVRVPGPSGTGTVDVAVVATVEYVDRAGATWAGTGGARRWYKRVTLEATGPTGFEATVSSVYAAAGV